MKEGKGGNFLGVHNSPLNNSPSKMLYSFTKSNRFKDVGQGTICSQAYYNLPSVKSCRKAGFGYGNKYDFTKVCGTTPAPNKYGFKGEFEIEKEKMKGFSFGLGREQMIVVEKKGNMPGPGAYDQKNIKGKVAYSIRPRTLIPESKLKTPGPGQYALISSINPEGKYQVSKFKNSGAGVINPPSSKRFPTDLALKVPGPGNYQPNNDMGRDGKYVLSKFKGSGARTFCTGKRGDLIISQSLKVPGPGCYQMPSDFGIYEAFPKNKQIKLKEPEETNEPKEEKSKTKGSQPEKETKK